MTTGKEVKLLAPAGEAMDTLYFVPDGGMVMQTSAFGVSRLIRFDKFNTVVAQAALPSGIGPPMRYVADPT